MAEPSDTLEALLAAELSVLDRAGFRRTLRAVGNRQGALVTTEQGEAIDFSSNDYLGLASHPAIAQAAVDVLGRAGVGGAAARLIAGNDPWHSRLEARIAAFKETESALIFPTGYAANTGAIPALMRRGDVIYTDRLNHASLIDGCRLSRAETKVFGHNDMSALEAMLTEDIGKFSHRWIVVDGVFSMDGDCAPLDRLVPLARRYGAFTYIDDAHGTGVLGMNGRGSVEHFGVEGQVDVMMGTLGKAFGTLGAYVAGSRKLCDWLLNRARSFVFTTSTPPALSAAAIAAIDLATDEPWRREMVRSNASRIRIGLGRLGLTVPGADDGHIIPVVIGGADTTSAIGEQLRHLGILVGAVRPPTVPIGGSRLRITASAAHTPDQIDALLDAIAAVVIPQLVERSE